MPRKPRSDKGQRHKSTVRHNRKMFADLQRTRADIERFEQKEKLKADRAQVRAKAKKRYLADKVKKMITYRRSRRAREIPANKQCPGCGCVRLKPNQWVVITPAILTANCGMVTSVCKSCTTLLYRDTVRQLTTNRNGWLQVVFRHLPPLTTARPWVEIETAFRKALQDALTDQITMRQLTAREGCAHDRSQGSARSYYRQLDGISVRGRERLYARVAAIGADDSFRTE